MVTRAEIRSDVVEICHVLTRIPKSKITDDSKLGRGPKGLGMTAGLIELLYDPFTKVSKKHPKGVNVRRWETKALAKKAVKDATDLVHARAKGEVAKKAKKKAKKQ